ncbi:MULTISPECIES: putative manganese transporter [unclassified Nocardioides]|uniref:putative manganese transporter n=1 Tax=unclassified Nocardioides TaxID=2615069 RepID=UPI002665ADB8|nr:putative manganese transporter [Nocardioides sp. Arc9.136]WKN50585.1 arsenic efflux protein [Nocardioides sp. Arc9.136]
MTDLTTELLLRPLADAFMEVGVFVALLVVPFGWARHRWGHRLDDALERHRRLGPLVAALLTVPPGCGGAIIVMSVYARGAVSYGAAVSALVATMGDASWVLLAADPVLTLQMKVLLVATGAATGYVVDAVGIAPRRRVDTVARPAPAPVPVSPAPALPAGAAPARRRTLLMEAATLPALMWLLLGAGATVSLPTTFELLDPAALGHSLLGGVDPYLAIGLVGSVLAVGFFLRNGCKLADDTVDGEPTSMQQVLAKGADEVSFVTVWVAAAYVAWSLLTHLTGFDGSQLPVLGFAGVLVGALIGLVPGCAVQIVFAGLFLAGGMPVSTLVANSISQDGDALIPLLAMEHRSALLATVLTTIPAIVVGSALLVLT